MSTPLSPISNCSITNQVIMLCGPPGLGKTTLAQVVARHAGYRVYEINASDDRSATVLRKRMTEAMEGNTLLADRRPNLIVLDEVCVVSCGVCLCGSWQPLFYLPRRTAFCFRSPPFPRRTIIFSYPP